MNQQKRKLSRSSPRPLKPMPNEVVPLENVLICISLSEFLCFEDFRSLVLSVWPNKDAGDIIRSRLWQLSTHIAEIPFINGKPLRIEYNYNPWRTIERRILINIHTLLPIFGQIVLPAMNNFCSVSQIKNFVKMHVHLNACSDYRHRSCSCCLKNYNPHEARDFAEPSVDECEFQHFHHYCSQHVIHWLKFFLNPLLTAKQENSDPDKDDMQSYLSFLSNAITFWGTNDNGRGQSMVTQNLIMYVNNNCNCLRVNKLAKRFACLHTLK